MARPRVYEGKRVTTAVRLPEQPHDRLQEEANARDLSVNLLVTRALDEFLDRLVPVEELLATNRGN